MYISVALVCALLSCACAWLWLQGRRARALLAHLPTFPPLPFVGNFHYLAGGGEVVLQRLSEMRKFCDETDLPFLLWIGTRPAVIFMDPEDIREVTNAFVEKPYYYGFGRIWLGNGLLTASVPLWKRSIKKLSGTFNRSIVEGYQPVFNAQAQKLTTKLMAKAGGAPFDATHDLGFATMESITQTALGLPLSSESIVTEEYFKAFQRVLELLSKRGFNLLTHSEAIFKLTPGYRELNESLKVVHSVSNNILSRRRNEWEEKRKKELRDTTAEKDSSKTKFKSFLDILLELSESDPHFTLEQIKDEVDTIIVGGQETAASTLLFALVMLGKHGDVQEKLCTEFKDIFGESTRGAEPADLVRMRYCEAVLLETLRLFPPVPALMRYADRDLQLKSCMIPKGTGCGVNVWGAGRSERLWGADAAQFRPARWLQPRARSGNDLLAFSSGRRACIGRKYAMSLMKTTLSHVVRSMRVQSPLEPPLRLKFDLALKPVEGHFIQLHLRK